MKKIIYFIDIKCKQPYTFATMSERAIGGTESTMLRVADRLSDERQVYVVQPCRQDDEVHGDGLSYLSLDSARKQAQQLPPDHVVVIRKIKAMQDMATWFPGAKLYLWIQDLPVKKYCRYRHQLVRHQVTMVCNTNWQRGLAEEYLSPDCWYQRLLHPLSRRRPVDMVTIYNVISPDIQYEPTEIDEDKLVFFSAPRKGLKQVLEYFEDVLKQRPQTKLYIANPGYQAMGPKWVDHPNLINLGSLSNKEVIRHVREAFCVFYPQTMLPETFGVVYAEANTVGTPVL
ncbi:MAG: glycosyltransferase, partial [Gammaproteobacteria bacterium]|nr:glycosyltransferase [Gammaproteobacteria bacterium]